MSSLFCFPRKVTSKEHITYRPDIWTTTFENTSIFDLLCTIFWWRWNWSKLEWTNFYSTQKSGKSITDWWEMKTFIAMRPGIFWGRYHLEKENRNLLANFSHSDLSRKLFYYVDIWYDSVQYINKAFDKKKFKEMLTSEFFEKILIFKHFLIISSIFDGFLTVTAIVSFLTWMEVKTLSIYFSIIKKSNWKHILLKSAVFSKSDFFANFWWIECF